MKNSKFLFLTTLLFFPIFVSAEGGLQVEVREYVLNVTGSCTEDASLLLIETGTQNESFSTTVSCVEGEYQFQEDLSVWNLPKTSYDVFFASEKLAQPLDLSQGQEGPEEHKTVSIGSEEDQREEESKSVSNPAELFRQGLLALEEAVLSLEKENEQGSYRALLISFMKEAIMGLRDLFTDYEKEQNDEAAIQNLTEDQEEDPAPEDSLTASQNEPENQDSQNTEDSVEPVAE